MHEPAPRFSVITPVYNPALQHLREAIASVEAQTYESWELVLVDDASTAEYVKPTLRAAAERDPRIRVVERTANGGIVAASNDGVAAAAGEYLAFLDHDDVLTPDALELVAAGLDQADGEVGYAYTDHDVLGADGVHYGAFFKPAWSPERFRCQMYTNHLGVFRRDLVEQVGGFHAEFEGSQDFDLVFRVSELGHSVVHVPEVAYHWRAVEGSTALSADAKDYAFENGAKAIQAHCIRTGFEAVVEDEMLWPGLYLLRPALRDHPLVSVIIPTGGSERDIYGRRVLLVEQAVESLVTTSSYENYEVVVVVDDHVPDAKRKAITAAGRGRVRWVPSAGPFNFASKCNSGALHARGEHLLFLNDDTEVIAPDWMEALLMYSRAPGVGAVGARLLFADGRIQHVGVVFPDGLPGHLYRGYPSDFTGYFGSTRLPCNYQALTAACLMSPREAFLAVGGMSVDFPVNFNDVDYCLKLREAGYRLVYSPGAELRHHESSSRAPTVEEWEVRLLEARWGNARNDPYYNPHLVGVHGIPPVLHRNGEPYPRWSLSEPLHQARTARANRSVPNAVKIAR